MIQGFKQQRRKIESGLLIRHCERKRNNPTCRAKKERKLDCFAEFIIGAFARPVGSQ